MWGSVQGSSGSLQTGLHQPGVPWLSPGPPCPASQITPPAPHHSKAPHPMVPAHCCLPRRMRVAILLDATQSVPPQPPQQKGTAHRGARPGATARPHCPSCHVGVQSPACPGGEISPNLPMPTTSVSLRRGGVGVGTGTAQLPQPSQDPFPSLTHLLLLLTTVHSRLAPNTRRAKETFAPALPLQAQPRACPDNPASPPAKSTARLRGAPRHFGEQRVTARLGQRRAEPGSVCTESR